GLCGCGALLLLGQGVLGGGEFAAHAGGVGPGLFRAGDGGGQTLLFALERVAGIIGAGLGGDARLVGSGGRVGLTAAACSASAWRPSAAACASRAVAAAVSAVSARPSASAARRSAASR